MSKISDVITRLLPKGTTVDDASASWTEPPQWPPDLFAVVATIASQSGLYSDDRYSGRASLSKKFLGPTYLKRVMQAADSWKSSGVCPVRVVKLWTTLIKHWNTKLSDRSPTWRDAIIELIAITDESCAGIGIDFQDLSAISTIERELFYSAVNSSGSDLTERLRTICIKVPSSELCVQPKTITSQVGCTVRSLTHHLALLPSKDEVETRLQKMGSEIFTADKHINLVVVPYPYEIRDDAFVPLAPIKDAGTSTSHFSMVQTWLPPASTQVRDISDFLLDLIGEATKDCGEVHGVVLPEIALDKNCVEGVLQILAKKTGLDFFITGALRPPTTSKPATNMAVSAIFTHGEFLDWDQLKHHRWKLDRGQISRYKLKQVLKDADNWWEEIDISNRQLSFFIFRPGMSLAALVCEDLARIDPVQPVLRAIGPNLVIALLQDGPQWKTRWPARYATVLAEDPGCSVLTITSAGMVERSMSPGDLRTPRTVALWKDAVSEAVEIDLPRGAHAVLLKLDSETFCDATLDGRSDNETSMRILLKGAFAVTHPNPPSWIKRS